MQNHTEATNLDYYHEYMRLYIANVVLTNQLKELINDKNTLLQKLSKLEVSPSSPETNPGTQFKSRRLSRGEEEAHPQNRQRDQSPLHLSRRAMSEIIWV